jgi:hypothetical protein
MALTVNWSIPPTNSTCSSTIQGTKNHGRACIIHNEYVAFEVFIS